jgi:signal transduction histidine kinase
MDGTSERRVGGTAGRPVDIVLNLIALGLLVWGLTRQAHLGGGGAHLAVLLLLVGAVSSWLVWVAAGLGGRPPVRLGALVGMVLLGGALVAFASLAIVFVAVASLSTAMGWRTQTALMLAIAGGAAMALSVEATGAPYGAVLTGVAASCAGLVIGIGRREAVLGAEHAALVKVEQERTEVQRGRAELLAERNHLARELHDVLAHTLSALSLQLEAFSTVLDADPPKDEIRRQLEGAQQLVREGLAEARGAVRALREDAEPLPGQLRRLCGERQVPFTLHGSPVPLGQETSLALYRIAQEALTNAVKHAPGAPVSVCLDFAPNSVGLAVENKTPTGPPAVTANSGGGYGLQGIAERLALLGGRLEVGPTPEGWRVRAEVPT